MDNGTTCEEGAAASTGAQHIPDATLRPLIRHISTTWFQVGKIIPRLYIVGSKSHGQKVERNWVPVNGKVSDTVLIAMLEFFEPLCHLSPWTQTFRKQNCVWLPLVFIREHLYLSRR